METTNVHRNSIQNVFTTKKGLHEFLTIQMQYYLPAVQYTNMAWLSGIWKGKKKVCISSSYQQVTFYYRVYLARMLYSLLAHR